MFWLIKSFNDWLPPGNSAIISGNSTIVSFKAVLDLVKDLVKEQ
jgi:hypothetical protein